MAERASTQQEQYYRLREKPSLKERTAMEKATGPVVRKEQQSGL